MFSLRSNEAWQGLPPLHPLGRRPSVGDLIAATPPLDTGDGRA